MDVIKSFYQQNQSAIHLVGLVLVFFLVARLLTNWSQTRSNMTPPYSPSHQTGGYEKKADDELAEGYYVITGSRNNEFCSDTNSGLICNRNFVKDWERFYIKPLGDHVYAIRGGRAGQWCRSAPIGMICDADDYSSPDTHFKIQNVSISNGGNEYKIRSLSADPSLPNWCADYGNGLSCNQQDYNAMDIFNLYPVSSDFEGGDEKRWI